MRHQWQPWRIEDGKPVAPKARDRATGAPVDPWFDADDERQARLLIAGHKWIGLIRRAVRPGTGWIYRAELTGPGVRGRWFLTCEEAAADLNAHFEAFRGERP